MNGGEIIWGIAAIVASLIFPPAIGLLFRWLHARHRNNECMRLSLKQLQLEFFTIYRSGEKGISLEKICAIANLVFSGLAFGMIVLRMNLMPAIFLFSFASLSPIVAGLTGTGHYNKKQVNRLIQEFFLFQGLLYAAAVGFFLATGSFNLSASMRQLGGLFVELPILTMALIGVAYTCLIDAFSGSTGEVFLPGGVTSEAGLINMMGEIYRIGFFLLVASLMTGAKGLGAILLAFIFYATISWVGHGAFRLLRRYRIELNRGYILFAVGVNLIWLYSKYV